MKKPAPKTVKQVCTLCGLDWGLHGDAPTTDKCVELLLGEIRSLNAALAHRPAVVNPIYPTWPRPYYPNVWYGSITSAGTLGSVTATNTMLGSAQHSLAQGAMPAPRDVKQ